MQVVGICRFSWAGLGGFRRTPQDVAAQAAYLFDPARLARRMALFEAVTLPGLIAQTDPDFRMVFVTATALPPVWLDRLRGAVAQIPGAVVSVQPPIKQWRAMRDALLPLLPNGPMAQFRLDDDDALAVDFVARLRADARRFGPGWAFDYTGGLRAVWGPQGLVQIEPNPRIHTAQGMALVTPGPGPKTIMSYPHHKIWREMPMITQPEPVMFLQSTHADQDSGVRPTSAKAALDPDQAGAILSDRFALDLSRLNALKLPQGSLAP